MTRQHQLETTLRTLKLSGMLETLEARLAQARAGELGHLEFLQVLCEDEINRRVVDSARKLEGLRRQHSVHAAGVDRTSKGDPEDNSRAVYVVRSNLVRGNPPRAPKR